MLKDNKIIRVAEISKDFYLAKGFKVVDEHNKVVEGGAPKDKAIAGLEKQVIKLKADNEALVAENGKLKTENEALKVKLSEKVKKGTDKDPKDPDTEKEPK
jgi:regulator of replication initiation timing